MNLPRLYAIVDVSCFAAPLRTTAAIVDYAKDLAAGGATFIQYRNKVGWAREMLSHARELRRTLGDNVTLIMNDRADICIAAGYQGVHVGQDDLSPEGARTVIGPDRVLGVSTHNLGQLRRPMRARLTTSPLDRSSRPHPSEILTRWWGSTDCAPRVQLRRNLWSPSAVLPAPNARSVIEAGADSVAVIADLLSSPAKVAEEFSRLLV